MSTRAEQTLQNASTPLFVSEWSMPLQEPLAPTPLVEAFLPDVNGIGLPREVTLLEVARVSIEGHTGEPNHDPVQQLQRTQTDRIPLLSQTRASRLAVESAPKSSHPFHEFMRKTLVGDMVQFGGLAQWAIEFIPGFIWGPGDALSLYMAIKRKNPLTGEKIDLHEARLCAVAACIPFVPAKALTGPARMVRRLLEEGHYAIQTHDYGGIKKAITLKNVARLALSII